MLRNILSVIAHYSSENVWKLSKIDFNIIKSLVNRAINEIYVFRKSEKLNALNVIMNHSSTPNSIFINSYGVHHRDFDEVSFSLGGHPMATLLPISLAFNQENNIRILYQALKLEIILGKIFNPELYNTQYHPTTIVGLIGSTFLTAKFLNLTHSQVMNSLGIAFSFFSGMKGNFGSDSKYLQVAHATQQGYFSALYSKYKFTSNIDLLDNNNTLSFIINKKLNNTHVEMFTTLLNSKLDLSNEFLIKKYDVCGSFHSVIEMALLDKEYWSAIPIEKIIILLHPERVNKKIIDIPRTSVEKKFAPKYLYAYAFLEQDLSQITSSNELKENVTELMKKIEIEACTDMDKWKCITKLFKSSLT